MSQIFYDDHKKERTIKEKRKYPRISVSVLASYDCYGDDNKIFEQNVGTILDISEGGLLLETDSIIDANYVKLVIVGFDNTLYSIIGSVVHSRKIDRGKARAGICFHGSTKSNKFFLTAVIRANFYSKTAS